MMLGPLRLLGGRDEAEITAQLPGVQLVDHLHASQYMSLLLGYPNLAPSHRYTYLHTFVAGLIRDWSDIPAAAKHQAANILTFESLLLGNVT